MATGNIKTKIEVGANTQKAQAGMKSLGSSMAGVAAQVGLAALALAGFREGLQFLKESISLAAEHERAYAILASSVRSARYEFDDLSAGIEAFTDRMQTLSGISDEVVATGLAQFIDATQDLGLSMRATELAMDLSIAKGEDFMATARFLAEAFANSTASLAKYGITIDQTKAKTIQWNEALQQLEVLVGGTAEDQADTLAVKIGVLGQRFGDLKETIADIAVEPLKNLVTEMNGLIVAMRQFVKEQEEIEGPSFLDRLLAPAKMAAAIPGVKEFFGVQTLLIAELQGEIAGLNERYEEEQRAAEAAAAGVESHTRAVTDTIQTIQLATMTVKGRTPWQILADDLEGLMSRMARAQRVHTAVNQAMVKVSTWAITQQVSLARAAGVMLKTIAFETAAAELEANAKVWVAKALAAAASYQFASAAKFAAAAALATGGAAWLRSEVAAAMATGVQGADFEDIDNEFTTATKGRTVVAQGPQSYTFNSSFTINGHVMAIDEVKEIFMGWYAEHLRSKGLDVQAQSKG